MRLKIIMLSLLLFSSILFGEIHPQGGFETYVGSNKLFTFTPWVGLRLRLTKQASLIFKYYNHNLRFNYLSNELGETKRVARLSNFTTVLYAQKWGHDFYSAVSYFLGSDSYRALALDAGTALRVSDRLAVEVGIYLLNEKSVLWYPDEEARNIGLYSVKGGVKYKINKKLSISPKIYLYKNSEDVTATTFSIGLTFVPKQPIFLSLHFFRYSESSQYRFSGNYVSLGLSFYY